MAAARGAFAVPSIFPDSRSAAVPGDGLQTYAVAFGYENVHRVRTTTAKNPPFKITDLHEDEPPASQRVPAKTS
jgi:hypothetical protein